jgi:chromosome segregation ATPase
MNENQSIRNDIFEKIEENTEHSLKLAV